MRCRVPILLCALLLCSAALGAPVAAQQQQPGPDGTHLDVQLQADGDATWEVTTGVPIADDEDRAAFEAFASRFEAGEAGLDLGGAAFERAAAEAEAASGREMSITSMRRDSGIVNATEGEDGTVERYGVLRLTFTWESFARVDANETIYVGDAFNTTDGTWLSGLAADQTLTIRPPPGYGSPTTSPIGAEGGNLHWEGPATFEPGYFTIVYHPSPVTADGVSTPLVAGALALSAAALALGVYLLVARRRGTEPAADGDEGATASEPPASAEGAPEPAASPSDGPATGDGESDAGDEAEGQDDGDSAETESVDLELLSDEERVEHLLERNGGRMKQATIVKETGWSNAKVSQLLSSMDDDDRIDKLRIGRENLISLPGEGVGALDEDGDAADS
jgi:hypothetical protein